MAIAVEIAVRLEVAETGDSTVADIDIVDGDVFAAFGATQDVVVSSLISGCPRHVSDNNIRDTDASCRVSCWAAIEVVLLNVNSVDRDVLYPDVFVEDVVDVTGRVLVGLDTYAVLGIQDYRVAENHVGHIVVRLAAHRADGKTVTTVAVHIVDKNVVSTGDSYAVILVDYDAVAHYSVVCRCQTKTVAVVRSRKTIGALIGRIARAVIECDVVNV